MSEGETGAGLRRGWTLSLLLYAAVVTPLSIWQRDQINPDGIAYLRHALYLAEGRFADSISGYWSPLLLWCLAPFQLVGCDGLYAARIVMALSGAALVAASALFLRRCTGLSSRGQCVSLALIALAAAYWTTQLITPDVLLGAALLAYAAFAGSPQLVRGRSAAWAGGFGGIAFLAKAYAFPFFIVHFSFSIGLRALAERRSISRRAALRAWAIGMLTFLLVTSPWVASLSWKYGGFTVTTSGPLNHAMMGPEMTPELGVNELPQAPIDHMQRPSPGRMSVWEEPETLPYVRWSPFESSAHLRHQLDIMARNMRRALRDLTRFDALGIGPVALFALLGLGYARREPGAGPRLAWTLGTFGIFLGGLLPVSYYTRYVQPFLWPLFCMLLLDAWWKLECGAGGGERPRSRWRHGSHVVFTAVLLLSLAIPWATYAFVGLSGLASGGPVEHYRSAAARLAEEEVRGPVATTREFRVQALYLTYHLNDICVGAVTGETPAEVERELLRFGVGAFLADSRWPLAGPFQRSSAWRRRGVLDAGGRRALIFSPPSPERGRGAGRAR